MSHARPSSIALATTAGLAVSSEHHLPVAPLAPVGWLAARTGMPLRRAGARWWRRPSSRRRSSAPSPQELLAAPSGGLLGKIYRGVTGAPGRAPLQRLSARRPDLPVVSCYAFPYVVRCCSPTRSAAFPADLEDASSILGGRAWATARRITVPLAHAGAARGRAGRAACDAGAPVRLAGDPVRSRRASTP